MSAVTDEFPVTKIVRPSEMTGLNAPRSMWKTWRPVRAPRPVVSFLPRFEKYTMSPTTVGLPEILPPSSCAQRTLPERASSA